MDREEADHLSDRPGLPVTGSSWSLLLDTRVLRDGSEVAAPASPLPELGGGLDLDWGAALPSSPDQPLTSASKSSNAIPALPCSPDQPLAIPVLAASPVRLVLPTAKLVLQRLADWQLPAPQVLKFCVDFL